MPWTDDDRPCDCCSSVAEHIGTHYDPAALSTGDEDPSEVLALFQRCFPDRPLDIDVRDVAEYLDDVRGRPASRSAH